MSIRSDPYSIDEGSDNKFYPKGPGQGFGYYSGTLWSTWRFDTAEPLKIIVPMLNEAYHAGYTKAQQDIQKALGVRGI